MRKPPKRTLRVPTLTWVAEFKPGRRLAENTKGKLIKTVIIPMLNTEPNPKRRMYTIPASEDSMEANTNSVKAALPAKPWTAPIR